MSSAIEMYLEALKTLYPQLSGAERSQIAGKLSITTLKKKDFCLSFDDLQWI